MIIEINKNIKIVSFKLLTFKNIKIDLLENYFR